MGIILSTLSFSTIEISNNSPKQRQNFHVNLVVLEWVITAAFKNKAIGSFFLNKYPHIFTKDSVYSSACILFIHAEISAWNKPATRNCPFPSGFRDSHKDDMYYSPVVILLRQTGNNNVWTKFVILLIQIC